MSGLKVALLLGMAGAFGSGCASTPVPQEQLTMTQATIAAAVNNGAERQPEAAGYLQQAREKLASAQHSIERGDHRAAALTLEEGEADARLAVAVAQARMVQKQVREQSEEAKALQHILQRSSP